jgi:hypothetical protein
MKKSPKERFYEITIYSRHAESCKFKSDKYYVKCDCVKQLSWSHFGKPIRPSADTMTTRTITERFL